MLSDELRELRDNNRRLAAAIRQVKRDIAWNHVIDDAIHLCRVLCKAELAAPDAKYRADQPRVTAGNPDGGQWTDVGGAGGVGAWSGEGNSDANPAKGPQLAQARGGLRGGRGRPPVTEEEARRLPPEKNPAVREGMARADRYDDAAEAANRSFRALRKLDPDAPRPKRHFDPDDTSETSTQQLRQYQADAEARIKQLSGTRRTVIYDLADDAPGNIFTKKNRQGTLSGDVNRLGDHERKIVSERREDGVDVQILTPRSEQGRAGRTNDVKFNGQNYEIKESKTKSTDPKSVSGSISGQITDAAGQRPPGQSINVLIDARGVPGMTKETAIEAMKRAGGRFDDRGNRTVDSMTILTPGGRVTTKRQK